MNFKHTKLSMRKQQGFSLAELSVTTVITTMIIIGGIQMQAYQATQEAAQSIAQMYQRINRAAESYMANYYGQIKTLPSGCSNVGWFGNGFAVEEQPPAPPKMGCGVILGSVAVVNGLQPTLDELDRLGLLARAGGSIFTNHLPMPTFAATAGSPLQMVNSGGAAAPAQYAVLIRQVAIAGGGTDLQSLVYNLQPYNLTNSSRSTDTLLDMIIVAAGGDALLADNLPGTSGQLRGQAGASGGNSVDNPLQVKLNGVVQGAPYILALRGGFGSSGYDQFVRRDGTQTLTAAWNVGNKDITGIDNLGAKNGIFTGTVSAATGSFSTVSAATGSFTGDIGANNGNFRGNINVVGNGNFTGDISGRNGTLSGNLGVTGDLSANKGTFTGLLSGVSATFSGALQAASARITGALEAASATISGALQVAGNALLGSLNVTGATSLGGSLGVAGATTLTGSLTASGSNALTGQTTADKFRLGSEAQFGTGCSPEDETVRRVTLNNQGNSPNQVRILVCDPSTRTWTYPVDFTGTINGAINTAIGPITSNLGSVSGSIGTINNNISTINTNITNLGDRVTTLENNLSTVSGSVSTLQSGYASLNTSVGSLQSSVGTLQTDVADLKKYRLKWDIVNITWEANTGNVWKKTPWACQEIGQLSAWDSNNKVRYLQNASGNQTGTVYTPPIIVGLDNAPGTDTVVYDINCEGGSWYIGMSAVKANTAGGNLCRSGLTLKDGTTCENSSNITLNARNYSPSVMSARFIAFTRTP